MKNIKRINRNAFNEKLIHRYLFERLYFGKKHIRNGLLPSRYHNKKINLIVPEEIRVGADYRADLMLYFKDDDKGVPVEIKWSGDNLKKDNQLRYLKDNNGFVVSFKFSNDLIENGIENFQIDFNDFLKWASNNIGKLSRESLIYQANVHGATAGNQFWIVLLRGTAHDNFNKMLKEPFGSPFWAFQQNKHSLKNILDLQAGDKCLFFLGCTSEGVRISSKPHLSIDFNGWYATTIKEPYYMVLKGRKSTFFEKGEMPINKRRWPHFTDFSIDESFESLERLSFGKRGEFAQAFASSYNFGAGAPAPITRRQWDTLIDRLRYLSS